MLKTLSSLLLISFLPLAQASIQSYQAEYQLYWQGLAVGSSQHVIKQTGPHHYVAFSRSSPKLKFLPYSDFERSEFTVHQHQVQPQRYIFQTQEGRKKLEGSILFDWQTKKINKHFKNQAPQHEPLPALSQDKITQFFQLREDLKRGKQALHYTIIEPKKTKQWQIRILGSERLNTPLGVLETVKLEHVSDSQQRRTQFWLAKDLDYLMVRLVQIRKGRKTAEVLIQKCSTFSP